MQLAPHHATVITLRLRRVTPVLVTAALVGSLVSFVAGGNSASASQLPSVPGLVSRWVASDLALDDGVPVAQWQDRVGGVTVGQPVSARQPVYHASIAALGGQPGVTFARAAGQGLTATVGAGTVPPNYLAGAGGATVFVVMTTPSSITSALTTWFASTGSSTSLARVLAQVTSTKQASIGARRLDDDALVTVNAPSSAVLPSTAYALTGLLDFSGNQGRQYVNGTWALAKSLNGPGPVSPTGSQRVSIGLNGSDGNAMDGAIAEILVYQGALSPTDRSRVHSYIQDTYGVGVSDYAPTTTTSPPSTTSSTSATSSTTTSATSATSSTTTSATSSTTTSPTSSTSSTTAAGPMAAKVAAPTTFAPPATMAGAATTAATVVAKTASGTGLPGALVYLKFQATVGGGSAAVGGVRLTSSYQGFVADGSGQVVVQYTTPSVLPRGGKDVLTAANSSSGASSTDTSTYSFTTTAHWRFAPEPMGSPGSLRPGETVDVVATALDASWQPVPDAQVCLLLKAISGGGTATVAGVALTSKFRCFTGDAAGAVHVAYQVPLQLPATGMDEIDVRDTTSSLYNTSSFHGYSFGQLSQVTFAPSEIAAPGSLLPGAKVSLTLTPRDQTGAQVAGATIRLWLVSSTGAKGTVTSYALAPDGIYLSNSPKVFVSHTKTKMVVSYQFSKSAPGSGTDTVYAQVESADGSVTSQAAAQYTWGS